MFSQKLTQIQTQEGNFQFFSGKYAPRPSAMCLHTISKLDQHSTKPSFLAAIYTYGNAVHKRHKLKPKPATPPLIYFWISACNMQL